VPAPTDFPKATGERLESYREKIENKAKKSAYNNDGI
jgi:hypothetical protein